MSELNKFLIDQKTNVISSLQEQTFSSKDTELVYRPEDKISKFDSRKKSEWELD
jgi:hypothetical protein